MAGLHGLCTLPGELRNQIYEQLANDDRITILEELGDRFSTESLYLSRFSDIDQGIQKEYVSIAFGRSRSIETTVHDFDFTHVMAFLDHLTDKEINTFPNLDYPSNRRFIINLEIDLGRPPNLTNLRSWLDRFRRGCKGTEIEFHYEAHQNLDDETRDDLRHLLTQLLVDDGDFEPALETFMIRNAVTYAGDDDKPNRDTYAGPSVVDFHGQQPRSRRERLEDWMRFVREKEISARVNGWRNDAEAFSHRLTVYRRKRAEALGVEPWC